MNATKSQKQLIHINAPTRDLKEEFVQWATDDNSKTSCSDLNFDQANLILEKLGQKPHSKKAHAYGIFNKRNVQHMKVVSLTRQLGWDKRHPTYGRVADMDRLGAWLESDKSPVRKPLKSMSSTELTTIINGMTGMISKRYK